MTRRGKSSWGRPIRSKNMTTCSLITATNHQYTSCIIYVIHASSRYYKRFSIPDLDRCKESLSQDALSLAHANNTLIITVSSSTAHDVHERTSVFFTSRRFNLLQYTKPAAVLQMEKELQEELKKMKASKDGDVECNPSWNARRVTSPQNSESVLCSPWSVCQKYFQRKVEFTIILL